MNKPARAERTERTKPANLKPVSDADAKPRKPRASTGGDFNAELRALADKHRKKSAKLRTAVAKLELKLGTMRSQLDAADEPLRKIERVLADRPELPGLESESAGGMDLSGPAAPADQPMAAYANGSEVSP